MHKPFNQFQIILSKLILLLSHILLNCLGSFLYKLFLKSETEETTNWYFRATSFPPTSPFTKFPENNLSTRTATPVTSHRPTHSDRRRPTGRATRQGPTTKTADFTTSTSPTLRQVFNDFFFGQIIRSKIWNSNYWSRLLKLHIDCTMILYNFNDTDFETGLTRVLLKKLNHNYYLNFWKHK